MNIIQSPSPNHDERTLPIALLILHYTGMETGAAALAHMCDPQAKVAAHYMVEENGNIHQLVKDERRAWHAGLSFWAGETNINSASIGIEIVNGGHDFGLPDFPKVQISAVIALCKKLLRRHDITPLGVLAHSDIAPERKQDPGEKFPWQELSRAGIGYWPDIKEADQRVLFEAGARDRGVSIVQSGLGYLGYKAQVTGVLDSETRLIIAAFQRRYRPSKVDGHIDVHTMEILTHLANDKKTRNLA